MPPWLVCLGIAIVYVAGLYVPDILLRVCGSPLVLRNLNRDHADVILRRSLAVCAVCSVSWLPLAWFSHLEGPALRTALGLRWAGAVRTRAK